MSISVQSKPLPGILLGVIGAIVAIGMVLIIMWKVFTTIHDKREFARFEKERQMAKWDAVRGICSNAFKVVDTIFFLVGLGYGAN